MQEYFPRALSYIEDVLEPLTRENRDRVQGFDCGDAEMNSFIREYAGQQQRKRLSITYLVRYDPPHLCPGFIALSTAHVEPELTWLPRSELVYDKAPALLISRMGVDLRMQHQGIGTDLLAAARVFGFTLPVGCRFLVLHVAETNSAARNLYEKEGFRYPEAYEPDERGLLMMLYDLGRRKPPEGGVQPFLRP